MGKNVTIVEDKSYLTNKESIHYSLDNVACCTWTF